MKQTFCSRHNILYVIAHLGYFHAPIFPVLIGHTAIRSPLAILEECGYVIDVLRVSRKPAHKMFATKTVRRFVKLPSATLPVAPI